MVFTCFIRFIQAPFSHLHIFFTCLIQAPSFHLHVFLHVSYRPPFFIYLFFYMFHKGPLFSFTWFLQGFKHSVSRLFVAFGKIIYKLFSWFSKAIYMFFTTEDTVKVREKFYRSLHVLQVIIVKQDNVNQYLRNTYMLY